VAIEVNITWLPETGTSGAARINVEVEVLSPEITVQMAVKIGREKQVTTAQQLNCFNSRISRLLKLLSICLFIFDFSTVCDLKVSSRSSISRSKGFNSIQHPDTLFISLHLSKHNMLSIKPLSGLEANLFKPISQPSHQPKLSYKELRSIGIRTSIGHTQNTSSSMLQLEVFILELHSINGLQTNCSTPRVFRSGKTGSYLSSSSVSSSKVSTLSHKLLNDSMELASFEPESWFVGTQLPEVLSS
jgi:hypothetical protein